MNHLNFNSTNGLWIPGRPIPPDLRVRIAQALCENLDIEGNFLYGQISNISRTYGVSRRTVTRISKSLFLVLVEPNDLTISDLLFGGFAGSLNRGYSITFTVMTYILLLIKQIPGLYIPEIRQILYLHLNIDISNEWIRQKLHLGLYKEKIQHVSPNEI